jgi:hypothetical protein
MTVGTAISSFDNLNWIEKNNITAAKSAPYNTILIDVNIFVLITRKNDLFNIVNPDLNTLIRTSMLYGQ